MSFFTWFSGRSPEASAAKKEATRTLASRDKLGVCLPQRLAPGLGSLGDDRKVQRHARRERLYVAIREAMTRAGVLSASYKFKVLSLDQRGDEFLVMMDLAKVAGDPEPQLGEIEALIAQSAKLRFAIRVPAVYWRLNEVATVSTPGRHSPAVLRASVTPGKPMTSRYEPIQADEVMAFQQALLAASAQGPSPGAEKSGKTRSGLRSSPQLNDFEDTEMSESASAPALSNTQYGDLN